MFFSTTSTACLFNIYALIRLCVLVWCSIISLLSHNGCVSMHNSHVGYIDISLAISSQKPATLYLYIEIYTVLTIRESVYCSGYTMDRATEWHWVHGLSPSLPDVYHRYIAYSWVLCCKVWLSWGPSFAKICCFHHFQVKPASICTNLHGFVD